MLQSFSSLYVHGTCKALYTNEIQPFAQCKLAIAHHSAIKKMRPLEQLEFIIFDGFALQPLYVHSRVNAHGTQIEYTDGKKSTLIPFTCLRPV